MTSLPFRHASLVRLTPLLAVTAVTAVRAAAQQAMPPETPRTFAVPASWISDPDAPGDAYGVYHFRRTLELPAQPARFVVHVSADNRYRLYVNGRELSSGPQRSDVMHYRYETVDLAPALRAGRNVLAALVWNWGALKPVAQCSARTGFLLQGDGPAESAANTGPGWKVLRDSAYTPIPITYAQVRGYYAGPPGETVDGAKYPWGWETETYDDARWRTIGGDNRSGVLGRVQLYGVGDLGSPGTAPWQLQARTIPPMEESPVRFASVRRAEGLTPSAGESRDGFVRGTGDLVVPARTRGSILLDNGTLTNAYPVVETSGGGGSSVTLTYAEALRDAAGTKGNR